MATRSRITCAAADLILERGTQGTSLADIRTATKTSKSHRRRRRRSRQGLGRAAVELITALDCALMVVDINEANATQVDAETRATGIGAMQVDVSNEHQVATVVEAAMRQFGQLDGAYSSASIPGRNTQAGEWTTSWTAPTPTRSDISNSFTSSPHAFSSLLRSACQARCELACPSRPHSPRSRALTGGPTQHNAYRMTVRCARRLRAGA